MSLMQLNRPRTVSKLVQEDYRIADVFKKWGINYCCGGNMSLDVACSSLGLNQAEIERDLESATRNVLLPNTLAVHEWPFDFLVDYISNVHHAYVKMAGPKLQQLLLQFVHGHKRKYPHLVAVELAYNELLEAVLAGINRKEEIVFPYLKQLSNPHKQKTSYTSPFAPMVEKPLDELRIKESGHHEKLLKSLRTATTNYTFTVDACTNHQVIYHKLKEFDSGLVYHQYLENDILLPRAMQLEKELIFYNSSV